MTPTLIAQLSDPHLRLDEPVSQAALAAAVARVLTLNPLPAAVLVTGDIANSGDPAEHARALELLAPLPMPVHRLAGNHDLLPERTRYTADAHGVRIIACDTSIPGRDDGTLEVDWLAERLAEDRETPTLDRDAPPAAAHRPAVARRDRPYARAARRARRAAGEAPNVRRVVAGHVHRVIADTLGGCGVITCASTNIQSGLDFIATDMVLVNEPPSLLVHALLDSGELVTHVQPI